MANGAPSNNMYATDRCRKLWDLGFALFRDQERMEARFIIADIAKDVSGLDELEGKVDVVLACQILDAFYWPHELDVLRRIVRISIAGTVVLGYQIGRENPSEGIEEFLHSESSFQTLWNDTQGTTKTRWRVDVKAVNPQEWGMEREGFDWMVNGILGINFVVTREA